MKDKNKLDNGDICPKNNLLMLLHVTEGEKIQSICDGILYGEYCDVLEENVVYFSYGVPFYKSSIGYTEDSKYYPIVLALKSEVNKYVDYYFPFDSGAVKIGMFGEVGNKIGDIFDYKIKRDPDRIVSAFYGTNSNYVDGVILNGCLCKDKMANNVYSLISSHNISEKVDQRLRTIECVVKGMIDLRDRLVWIAYPDYMWDDVEDILYVDGVLINSKIKKFGYSTEFREKPSELVAVIKREFKREFKDYFIN